ncbi:MAG: hypothetical protein ACREPX_03435, partial [Rhodanobacteraceae bacterium]
MAAHEIAGHHGLRGVIAERAGAKGSGEARTALDSALDIARQNPTVEKLADAIGASRNSSNKRTMTEEALAELAAATRTGNYDHINERYGVEVPEAMRAGIKAAIARFIQRVKAMLAKLFKKAASSFSDADVHKLVEDAWQYVRKPRERAGSEKAGGAREEVRASDRSEVTETAAFKSWFGESKVVDKSGDPLVVYHGSARPERIGSRFRSKRATSGPMAFFTDDPKIASNYSTSKNDTSLQTPDDYAGWFKFKPKGGRSEVDIDRAWYHLSAEQRSRVAEQMPHVTNIDAEGNEAALHLGGSDAYGMSSKGHWDMLLREARGNVLQAAKEMWLNSGALFNDEAQFLKVLELGGMDGVRFDDPSATTPGVFPVYLSIRNPFDTANAATVVDALQKASARRRGNTFDQADQWDKRSVSGRDWMDRLRGDVADGTTHAWTSIPDWVTDVLKAKGHDGIKDTGGKNGGDIHAVWIPFRDGQVKSATGNRGSFDPRSDDILESRGEENLDSVAADDIPSPKREEELPSRRPGESQHAYARRVMRTSKEAIRAATKESKHRQKIGRANFRAMLAKEARAMDIADAAFSESRKLFDKTPEKVNLASIDQWENGNPVTDLDARDFFETMQKGFDERIARIRELAPDAMQQLIENYFPHMWEDSSKAAKWYQGFMARRPLEGNKSFMKQRTWGTIKEGMASGLKPVSTNPVDLALLKFSQMDKFIAFHELRKDLADRGWLRKMEAGERVPEGYAKVDDSAFQIAGGLQGYYAVPELIAKDINNHLAPSLYRFGAWKSLRKVQNTLMSSRLGWSAFHAGFTTLDNMVQHVGVGAQRLIDGDIVGGLKMILRDAPASFIAAPLEGGKLIDEWRGTRTPDAHTAALLHLLEQGGARYKMSATDYNNSLPKIIRAIRQRSAKGVTVGDALSAVGEMSSWLIHHWLVPRQKMAARVMLLKFELDFFAKKLGKERGDYAGIIDAMHPDVAKQLSGKVVDAVDNRLGQMTYDNQFWNKTAREVAQSVIGAVGWQVGTVRTVT